MKFVVTFKTPDAVSMSIDEAVASVIEERELVGEEAEEEAFRLKDLMGGVADRYVTYGEYVSIEFDTDEDTATVKER